MKIVLPEFAHSHFDTAKHSAAIPGYTPAQFETEINRREPIATLPGYASFCQLFFYENWTEARLGIIPYTMSIEPWVHTEYEARRESELPVLTRFVTGTFVPIAKYLCVIVYDQKQLEAEGTVPFEGDYGVVNILRLNEIVEPPMAPITMMRNALGIAEGGSGVPLDREKYKESVEFWSKHIAVKPNQ